MYGWLARYRHGGWGVEAKPLFDRPPKLNARAMQRGLDNDQKNFTRAMLRRWYTPYQFLCRT
jgi:hypothetical protein